MAKQAEILGDIARLEHELQRIAGELDVLRRRVSGTTRSGRTQAFAAAEPEADAAVTGAELDSHSRPTPASRPRPSPTVPPKTITRTIPPTPIPARRLVSPSLGIESDAEVPSSPPATSRREIGRTQRPEAGRYEFVSDGKQRVAKSGNPRRD